MERPGIIVFLCVFIHFLFYFQADSNILGVPIHEGLVGLVGESKASYSYVIVTHHIRKKKWLCHYLQRRGDILTKWWLTGTNEPYTCKISKDTILRKVKCAVEGDRFILASGENSICSKIVRDTFTDCV